MKKITIEKENDFKVHAQVVHKKKSKTRKIFNYVISGFMITTTLVSSINLKPSDVLATNDNSLSHKNSDMFVENDTLNSMYHLNLKNAVKVLDSAIKNNKLDSVFFDNVTKELDKISSFLDEKPTLKVDIELNETVKFTERVLKQEMSLSEDINLARSNTLNSLEVVQNKMGIEDRLEDLAWIKSEKNDTKLGDSLLVEGVKEIVSDVVDAFKPMEVEASSLQSYHDLSTKSPYYKQFQWAIANGYVKVSNNAKVNGKKVALVYPNATYKEADALMGITKYFWRKEVAQTKPANKKNSASVYYQVAQRKKLPVKSSYKSNSSPTLTKGQLAVLLVSAHYGKPVSLDTAIQKLYQAGITNGNKVGNGYPKTKESFGVNEKVTKTTFVLWMYNYKLNNGKFGSLSNITQNQPQNNTNDVDKYKDRIKVGGIYTHYGRTYQTRNQQEYDTAFNIIKTKVEQLKKEGWFTRADNTVYQAYVMYYKEGKRAEDFPNDPIAQWALSSVAGDTDFQYLLNKGFTVDELIQLAKMRELAFILEMEAGAKDPLTGEPRSIYDSLVRKQYDCDTTANVYMAIADIMGYDALIIASETHAECYVKAKGEWLMGTNVMTDNLFKLLDAKTHFLYTPPRTGLK